MSVDSPFWKRREVKCKLLETVADSPRRGHTLHRCCLLSWRGLRECVSAGSIELF